MFRQGDRVVLVQDDNNRNARTGVYTQSGERAREPMRVARPARRYVFAVDDSKVVRVFWRVARDGYRPVQEVLGAG